MKKYKAKNWKELERILINPKVDKSIAEIVFSKNELESVTFEEKPKEELKKRFCKKCNTSTPHLKCGFGEVGSLCGNGRWRCSICKTETR